MGIFIPPTMGQLKWSSWALNTQNADQNRLTATTQKSQLCRHYSLLYWFPSLFPNQFNRTKLKRCLNPSQARLMGKEGSKKHCLTSLNCRRFRRHHHPPIVNGVMAKSATRLAKSSTKWASYNWEQEEQQEEALLIFTLCMKTCVCVCVCSRKAWHKEWKLIFVCFPSTTTTTTTNSSGPIISTTTKATEKGKEKEFNYGFVTQKPTKRQKKQQQQQQKQKQQKVKRVKSEKVFRRNSLLFSE